MQSTEGGLGSGLELVLLLWLGLGLVLLLGLGLVLLLGLGLETLGGLPLVPTKQKRSRNLDSCYHSSASNDRNMSNSPRKLAAKINIERANEAVLIRNLCFAM